MNDLLYVQNFRSDTIDLPALAAIQDNYSGHFQHFARYCEERGAAVNYETIRDYFQFLNHSIYKANTVRIRRQAVKKRILQAAQDWPIDNRIRLKELLADLDRYAPRPARFESLELGADRIPSRRQIEKTKLPPVIGDRRARTHQSVARDFDVDPRERFPLGVT